MKRVEILVIALGVIFTSCEKKSEPVQIETISGSILNHKEKVLTLYDYLGKSQWEQKIEVKDSAFEIIMDVNQPIIISLAYGNNIPKDIFLMPNKKVNLSFNANDFESSFEFSGDLAVENSVLDSISSILMNMEYNIIYSQPLSIAVEYLDSLERTSKSRLETLTKIHSTTDYFKDYAANHIEYYIAWHKLIIARRKNDVPENYYVFLDKLIFTKPKLLDIPFYRGFLQSYVQKETDLRIKKLDSIQRQVPDIDFTESLKVIEQFKNEEIKSYALYIAMMTKLFDSETNDFKKYYEFFKKNNKDQHYEEQLQIALKERNKLASGEPAPGFTLTDINGKEISLSSFLGKYVYLDFWATTCIHSRKETDSYVQLYSDYATSEIEFVSISADLDENRWRNYVEEQKNVGAILRVENSWDSQAFQSYQISSSPTYVLIDKEGNIIDPVAPKPSSEEIRDTFDKLLNIK